MKNHIVKANRDFNDLKEKVYRRAGEVFEVTKERYEEMKTKEGLVQLLEVKKQPKSIIKEEKEIKEEKIEEIKVPEIEEPIIKNTKKNNK